MTDLQLDLFILGLIIMLNIIISIIYKKYNDQKQLEEKGRNSLGNSSVIVNANPNSFSFMPRFPFLILNRIKSKSLIRLKIIHNILCFLVYGLFIAAILFFKIKG
jgi:hypothetical protein